MRRWARAALRLSLAALCIGGVGLLLEAGRAGAASDAWSAWSGVGQPSIHGAATEGRRECHPAAQDVRDAHVCGGRVASGTGGEAGPRQVVEDGSTGRSRRMFHVEHPHCDLGPRVAGARGSALPRTDGRGVDPTRLDRPLLAIGDARPFRFGRRYVNRMCHRSMDCTVSCKKRIENRQNICDFARNVQKSPKGDTRGTYGDH